MIQKADVARAINLVKGVAQKAKDLTMLGKLSDLLVLASDAEAVVQAYLLAVQNIVPSGTVSDFPKNNLFNQLSWVGKNLGLLLPLFSGIDPFADARHAADALAAKYGLANA